MSLYPKRIASWEVPVLHELERRYKVDASAARVVFAPYRICPLGAHIDHQLGPVTAMAIDRGVLLAYAPAKNREVRLASLECPGEVRFDLDAPGEPVAGNWGNYARGAVRALTRCGQPLPQGFVGVISGPWSEGGLSSSAAVGIAYLLALEHASALEITPEQNVRLDQAIENDYLGLRNGILDPSGILLSRAGHLTLIDCRTGGHALLPAPESMPPWSIVLAFSGLRKALVATDYNRRVGECQAAARMLLETAGRTEELPLLGHVHPLEYAEHGGRLPEPLRRRAEHFFSETDRVQRGAAAWQRGDLVEFGRLMTASGESSIRNYECGCPPLVALYEILNQCDGVYGARFSGAGFRGCCVGLIDRAKAGQITTTVQRAYADKEPELAKDSAVVVCDSGDGARLLAAPHGLTASGGASSASMAQGNCQTRSLARLTKNSRDTLEASGGQPV